MGIRSTVNGKKQADELLRQNCGTKIHQHHDRRANELNILIWISADPKMSYLMNLIRPSEPSLSRGQ